MIHARTPDFVVFDHMPGQSYSLTFKANHKKVLMMRGVRNLLMGRPSIVFGDNSEIELGAKDTRLRAFLRANYKAGRASYALLNNDFTIRFNNLVNGFGHVGIRFIRFPVCRRYLASAAVTIRQARGFM